MEQPRLVKSESYATRLGYPHDSVVYLKDKCYFDEAFQKQPGYKPHWFMMNHGHPSVANVIMSMRWIITRAVRCTTTHCAPVNHASLDPRTLAKVLLPRGLSI